MTPRLARFAAVLLLTAITAGAAHVSAPPAAAVDGPQYVSLANAKRASVGKGPVSYSALLEQISHERALTMARNIELEHDMDYVSARLKAAGACITGLGEIIAWERGYPVYDPARTIESWWKSTGHHAIMVGDFNAAGGSHATATDGGIYSIMVFVKFCTPPPLDAGTTETEISRISGADRYATAAAISRARFAPGVEYVYVATGANFPDALAGAAAAAQHDSPVLLTRPDRLSDATRAEIIRLAPTKIIILGGPGAISSVVAEQLRRLAPADRLAGDSRYSTAAAVSRATFSPGVNVAYVATGEKFPDALAGGALAGRDGGPVLLVTQSSIPDSTRAELVRLKPRMIVVLGGGGAVSSSVGTQLKRYATSGVVNRLAGLDRYGTAVTASRLGFAGGSAAVFVATGQAFPDGLAGGPVAALVPGPVLLVKPTDLPDAVAAEMVRLDVDEVFILGGTSAVSNSVVNQINAVLP